MSEVDGDALDAAWEGVMIDYMEQDFPTSTPYRRQVPGWQCKACGFRYGTTGYPPNVCRCGARWRADAGDSAQCRAEGKEDRR